MNPTFPIDKNRKLISETTDAFGVKRKIIRLFADNGDSVDIEVEEHLPKPTLKPASADWTLISQELDESGVLHKIMLASKNGINQEFFIDEKLPPGSLKRASSSQLHELPGKKVKSTEPAEYLTSDAFIKTLLRTKVEELQNSSDGIHIYVAYRNHQAQDVFHGLLNNGFQSCPVLNKDGVTYHGFIDILDFINYFLGHFTEEKKQTLSIMEQHLAFKDKKVKDIIRYPLNKRNPFHPFQKGFSLYSVFEVLALEGIRRIPVIDGHAKLRNMISQMELVEFIHTNLRILGTIKEKPLSLISELFHRVEIISSSDMAVNAFQTIIKKDVNGVAVVDQNNRLIGSISSRDFKVIDADGKWWPRLYFSVEAFLSQLPESAKSARPKTPIFAFPSDTLGSVITKIHENKVHRIFIVNNEKEMRPIGVIGLREILKEVISNL